MLAKRLVQLRNKIGLTQEEVAARLNIARGTYAHYEIGKRNPDYDTLQNLADFFNVSTDYLLGRTDTLNPTDTIAAHRSDDPLSELPPEARKSLEEFQDYMLRKYGLKKD